MTEKHDAMWGPEAGEYIAEQQREIERLRAALEQIAKDDRCSDKIHRITNMALRGVGMGRKLRADELAGAIFAAFKFYKGGAFMQGNPENFSVDGKFDLVKISEMALKDLVAREQSDANG